ncbi:MAG: ferredoxin [Rhodospirillales bacterium]|nr:ferredoxin [Rhodospirillales bacterium]
MDINTIIDTIAACGLIFRGGFHTYPEDDALPTDGTVVLVGNAGPAMWSAFSAEVDETGRQALEHPLDDWISRHLEAYAESWGARVLYPFEGPPYLPFQRWAQRADAVFPSPIGPLIHPDFGLWHAYRGAFLFDGKFPLPPRDDRPNPCETCIDKPCLEGCPVNVTGPEGYDVAKCVRFLHSKAGLDCMASGCQARRACPVGASFRYDPDQASFHMTWFRRSQS